MHKNLQRSHLELFSVLFDFLVHWSLHRSESLCFHLQQTVCGKRTHHTFTWHTGRLYILGDRGKENSFEGRHSRNTVTAEKPDTQHPIHSKVVALENG